MAEWWETDVKRFAVQVALDTVAVVLTLAIFTFVRIQVTADDGSLVTVPVAKISGSLISYIAIGIILVLADTFIRPVVIALTGRLLLWSMGLFLFVLNAVIFALAAWLAPVDWVVANPELFWVFLVATVYTILQTIGSSILGLNRPIVDETGRGQLIWRFLDALPTPRRNAILENLRLQQVYDTIARYGLDIVVGGSRAARRLGPDRAVHQRVGGPDRGDVQPRQGPGHAPGARADAG